MTKVGIVKSILWNFAESIFRRGLTSIVTLVLAYILVPKDFGLIAIVNIFLLIGTTLADSGLKDALIRASNPTQFDFDAVFYTTISLGLIGCLLLISEADLIGSFFSESDLSILIKTSAIGIMLSAFQVVPIAILHRRLEYKTLFKLSIPSNVISSTIAIIIALLGGGVWSLVASMLISTAVMTFLLWKLKIWKPSINFCHSTFKKLFSFGVFLFLSTLLQISFSNAYVIILAKLFTTSVAGLYFFAEKIRDMLVMQLVNSIQTVSYPVLATIQDDVTRLKSGYRAIIIASTFVVFPAMLFLASVAIPLFKSFLPERWWSAGPYFQLLCIAGVLYPLHAININVLKVSGRSDLFFYLEVVKILIAIVVLTLGIKFGIEGILVGQIALSLICYIPNSYFTQRLINYSPIEQLIDFFPALIISILVSIIGYIGINYVSWPDPIKPLTFLMLMTLTYTALARFFNLNGYNYIIEVVTAFK